MVLGRLVKTNVFHNRPVSSLINLRRTRNSFLTICIELNDIFAGRFAFISEGASAVSMCRPLEYPVSCVKLDSYVERSATLTVSTVTSNNVTITEVLEDESELEWKHVEITVTSTMPGKAQVGDILQVSATSLELNDRWHPFLML